VAHVGHASFEDRSKDLIATNGNRLAARYPHYDAMVADFIRRDPLARYRHALDRARLTAQASSYPILFVTTDLDGGCTRHIQDLADALAAEGVKSLVLTARRDKQLQLVPSDLQEVENLLYDGEAGLDELVEQLRDLNVRHLHYHQRINMTPAVFELAERLGVTYDCTIHDYAWICPQVTLIDETGRYCGEPRLETCEKCLKLNGAHAAWTAFGKAETVAELRNVSRAHLAGARRVYCPSRDVVERLRRYFDLPNIVYKPHIDRVVPSRTWARTNGTPLRVAVIGALGRHKGFDIVRASAEYARDRRLPIHFVIAGFTCDDDLLSGYENVTITGRYHERDILEVLRSQNVSVAFFGSTWPETYSFTYSIALAAGLYPVAFDVGAIPERMHEDAVGIVLPLTDDPAICVQALLRAASLAEGSVPPIPERYASIVTDYYGAEIDTLANATAAV
jgi:glycosyltransferase involved in cell wall biosynthesis